MQTNTRDRLIITANSAASCLLSYIFVHLIFQLATISAAAIFDIPTTLYHNRIAYNVSPDTWTFDSVKVIFSAGNTMLSVLSVVFLVIYLKALEYNGILRLFFMWGFMHCLTILIGSAIIGAFNFEGFGIVMSYLYLTDTVKMVVLFAGLIVIMGAGLLMAKPMLFSANIYYNSLPATKRQEFSRFQLLYPYLASAMIIAFARFPLTLYEWLMLVVPLFYLSPVFWSTSRLPTFYFEETPVQIRLNLPLLISAAAVLLLVRVVLGIGLNFG